LIVRRTVKYDKLPAYPRSLLVVRQGHLIAVVVGTFLIGCALLLLVVGCAGTRSEAPQKEKGHTEATKEKQGHTRGAASEEDRCGGTRTFDRWGGPYITNDVPGCPNGGLLEGTDERDKLAGEAGEDKVHGLGAADNLWGGFGSDVMYGGTGDDFLTGSTVNGAGHDKSNDVLHGGPGRDSVNGGWGDDVLYGGDGDDVNRLYGDKGEDVLYGGDGNDFLDGSFDGQRDKLYCGKGKDEYAADKLDYVSSSCEEKVMMGRM
jgi:Ca2+-binding RTX toxin-like protein